MNAIELLKEDHDRIRTLLKEMGQKKSPQERRTVFGEFARELRVHERMEEEILYPALTQHAEGRDSALEGHEEHHMTDPLVRDLEETPTIDEQWNAKLKVLTETLEHHIKEEHDSLFPKAKRIFDKQELERMGTQMAELKATGVRG